MRKPCRAVTFPSLPLLGVLALGTGACDTWNPTDTSSEDLGATRTLARLGKAPEALRVADEYVVVFSEGVTGRSIDTVARQVERAGGINTLRRRYSVIPAFSARLDAAQVERLRADPGVAYIEEDREVSLSALYPSPADGVDRVDQRQGRDGNYNDYGATGAGVNVYVLDTGINTEHADFSGRISEGFTSVLDGQGIEDCNGHGTHVSSTLAGTVHGMAREATLHPVRVLRCNGRGTWGAVLTGLDFVAVDCRPLESPCVVNMSLTGDFFAPINAAVASLVNLRIPVVVAAGNDGLDACTQSPASEPKAITVAAVDDADARAWFSNWGACVDLFAPGVSILGASIGDAVATHVDEGTSMASPHVAGAIAQFLGTHRTATPAQVETNLKGAATLGCVTAPANTPNVLLFSDFNQSNFTCATTNNSCVGLCGEGTETCFCDPGCVEFNDCCPDYAQVCE